MITRVLTWPQFTNFASNKILNAESDDFGKPQEVGAETSSCLVNPVLKTVLIAWKSHPLSNRDYRHQVTGP